MITTFYVSLFALGLLIGSKVFELRVRKVHFISNLVHKGDLKIHQFIEKMFFSYNRYKKISKIFVFEFLPAYAYELLVKMKDYVAKKYYELGHDLRGKRVLRDRGSVSNFLQHITNDKTDISDNKI